MGPHTSLTAKKSWRVLLTGVTALAMTAGIAAAQAPAPVEVPHVPPPLSAVTVPDVNTLGLLDCSGAGLGGNCGTWTAAGFPITQPGPGQIGGRHRQDVLIALGKALFWEMQIGSDGVQACASCHFHAGADNRIKNQKNPGLKRVHATSQLALKNAISPDDPNLTPAPDKNPLPNFFGGIGPNDTLRVGDFPFPVNTATGPNFGNNDIVSSQGVHMGTFAPFTNPIGRVENGNTTAGPDPETFNTPNGLTVRRVPPRNSPSAIGAIFNLRNFWDGRANLFFNGVNPFGMLDPGVKVNTTGGGTLQVMIPFSSAASQAVGPLLSDFEMSLSTREFQHIAAKVLRPLPDPSAVPPTPGFIPLDRQAIALTDSVLGTGTGTLGKGVRPGLNLRSSSGFGLNISYIDLIKDVFQEKFWGDGNGNVDINLMRSNFALFFGLAVQAYEATLIPDRTPVDILLAGLNGAQPGTGTAVERGLAVFLSGRASCSACHFGSEMTSASVSHLTGFGDPALEAAIAGVPVPPVALAERMLMGDGTRAAYDTGFYNIGVRPTADDLSIFNRTDKNVPFSFGMLAQEILRGTNSVVNQINNDLLLSGKLMLPTSSTNLSPLPFAITVACAPGGRGQALGVVNGNGCRPLNANEHMAIRGSFKTPGLRNLTLTGPYMHNGSKKSISEVIDFYNLGGHFNLAFNPDNCRNNNRNRCLIGQVDFDAEITAGVIRPEEVNDVIAFLEALTDPRVAKEEAPFDHPQLCLPHGHNTAQGNATILVDLPAVGAGGHASSILTFVETLGRPDPEQTPPTLNGVEPERHDFSKRCSMVPAPNVN